MGEGNRGNLEVHRTKADALCAQALEFAGRLCIKRHHMPEQRSRTAVATPYRATLGPDSRTPAEVAAGFGDPLEAIHAAVHYCLCNEEVLQGEREEVLAAILRRGLDNPPYVPTPDASSA
jgi:hypothetical protein